MPAPNVNALALSVHKPRHCKKPVCVLLWIAPRASWLLSTHIVTEQHPSPERFFFFLDGTGV
jgi:hypothetical protein